MAVSTTTRLGLTRWSAGSDPLTRAQMDAAMASLETNTAMYVQGTMSGRPAASKTGRFYYATDAAVGTSAFSYDTGTAWVDIQAPLLYGSVAVQNAFGIVSTDGVATTVARSDHKHGTVAKPTYTVRIPHTFTVTGDVLVPNGDNYYIPPFFVPVITNQTVALGKVVYRINSGTSVTAKVQRAPAGGAYADVAGYGTLSITTADGNVDAGDVTLADGDKIALVVTAVSGSPKNLTVTIYLDCTVS